MLKNKKTNRLTSISKYNSFNDIYITKIHNNSTIFDKYLQFIPYNYRDFRYILNNDIYQNTIQYLNKISINCIKKYNKYKNNIEYHYKVLSEYDNTKYTIYVVHLFCIHKVVNDGASININKLCRIMTEKKKNKEKKFFKKEIQTQIYENLDI